MNTIINLKRKVQSKFRSKSALSTVENLFIFLISMIILLLIMKTVELFAIVKNSRDSLERAVLNTAAVNEYKLYNNFRENIITDEALVDFITTPEIIKVLGDEYNLIEKTDGMYKMKSNTSTYYYRLTNITANAVIDDNPDVDRYRITATADLYIPVNFLGFEDMEFNIDVSCVYASKLNAEY